MTSTILNGFSTLNRLMKKKEKKPGMSKATSISNLDSSNLYNKVMPLAASNNAPFEQTFRIKIFLPRDQLYVVRVGAKTKLQTLLENVCLDKQLDQSKYEFQHPVHSNQVFDTELTVGEVGFNEIRLALKSQRTNSQNSYSNIDVVKLRQISRVSDGTDQHKSISSDYSGTQSPYSSTISLNSMDSASVRSLHAPVAPMRKKRLAPRPPSEIINGNSQTSTQSTSMNNHNTMARSKLYVSSPNLTQSSETKDNNFKEYNNNNTFLRLDAHNFRIENIDELCDTGQNSINNNSNTQNNNNSNHSQDNNCQENTTVEQNDRDLHEFKVPAEPPVPRKRNIIGKKKAPAPPPMVPPRNLQKFHHKSRDTLTTSQNNESETGESRDYSITVHEDKSTLLTSNGSDIYENVNLKETVNNTKELDSPILNHNAEPALKETTTSNSEIQKDIESTTINEQQIFAAVKEKPASFENEEEIVENLKNETIEVTNQQYQQELIENSEKTEIEAFTDSMLNSESIDTSQINHTTELSSDILISSPTKLIETEICDHLNVDEKEIMISSDIEDGYRGNVIAANGTINNNIDCQKCSHKDIDEIDNVILESKQIEECPVKVIVSSEEEQCPENRNGFESIRETNIKQQNEIVIQQNKVVKQQNEMKNENREFISLKSFQVASRDNDFYTKFVKVNRSDSFHSTRIEYIETDRRINERSSSYISLADKHDDDLPSQLNDSQSETNRRKSTSELGAMPSLQSLLVMKSILNNSLKNIDNNISKSNTTITPTTTLDNTLLVESAQISKSQLSLSSPTTHESLAKRAVDLNTISTNYVNRMESDKQNEVELRNQEKSKNETKEECKRWTYQGPPSINLSTWRERPKSKIQIKSDTDYIFGHGTAEVKSKSENNKEDDEDKPVQQPIIVERQVNRLQNDTSTSTDNVKLPIVRSIELKRNSMENEVAVTKPTTTTLSTSERINTKTANPYTPFMSLGYVEIARRLSTSNTATQTLPTQRFNSLNVQTDVKATVEPKLNENEKRVYSTSIPIESVNHSKDQSTKKPIPINRNINMEIEKQYLKSVQTNTIPLKPTNGPNISIKIVENDKLPSNQFKSASKSANNDGESKFDQVILRKKEIIQSGADKRFSDSNLIRKNDTSFLMGQFTLRKTGLKDKILAESNPIETVQKNNIPPPPPPAPPQPFASLLLSAQQPLNQRLDTNTNQHSINKTGLSPKPIENNTTTKRFTPVIRSVTTKNNITIPVEPRDQLLDSIRSFNRNNLKKNILC